MRIGMLATVGERCGIAAYSRALIEGLETLPDTEVELIPITEGKQPSEHYQEQANRLNASSVDVVHVQHEFSFWGGILPGQTGYWELRYLIKKPIVLTAHTTYTAAEMLRIQTERRPHKWLGKQILLRNRSWVDSVEIAPFATAMTIVHTAAARQALIARGGKPGYITIIPTGVPVAMPAPTGGRAFRETFGLNGRRLITIFGYVAPNKGYELTLNLLASLPPDISLVIAGGARTADMEPYLEELTARIAKSNLSERVTLTGYLSDLDVAEAMAASDLVLAPHTQATGSYSVALPLTHGRPILASNMDCFQEIAARVDCMELFRAGDAADYGARLRALLEDDARRGKLAANARRYAERYSWPRVAAMTRRVYEAAITVYTSGPHHDMAAG